MIYFYEVKKSKIIIKKFIMQKLCSLTNTFLCRSNSGKHIDPVLLHDFWVHSEKEYSFVI